MDQRGELQAMERIPLHGRGQGVKFPGCLSFFCLDRDMFLMFFCDFGLVSLSLLKRSLFPLGYASLFGWVVVDPDFFDPREFTVSDAKKIESFLVSEFVYDFFVQLSQIEMFKREMMMMMMMMMMILIMMTMTWYSKQPSFIGCFNWIAPNLYNKKWFEITISIPLKTG